MKDQVNPLKELEKEKDRLACLYSYNLLDTEIEDDLEELNYLAASICETPVSLIVLLDKNRQWFKSHYGWDKSETERAFSFCHYTILEEKEIFEVKNASKDERFKENPLVVGEPNILYYCGSPLINPDGYRLGSLCVIDKKARKLNKLQKESLVVLSKQVVTHFELHKKSYLLELQNQELENEVEDRTNALLNIDKELKTYLYNASHDLRGPIATIIGLSQLGQENTDIEENQLYFKHILDTSHRLDGILQNLLRVMRIKNIMVNKIELSALNVREVILNILKRYKDEKVPVEIDIEPNLLFSTDKELLNIVLENLIDNSIKYSDLNQNYPLIKISVKEEKDDTVTFSIEDNGEGIKKEISENVYDMFYRGNIRSKGSGLGLYIAKKAVEKLDGQIQFISMPNKLTTFTVRFKKS